jgi:hypothetical protein
MQFASAFVVHQITIIFLTYTDYSWPIVHIVTRFYHNLFIVNWFQNGYFTHKNATAVKWQQ